MKLRNLLLATLVLATSAIGSARAQVQGFAIGPKVGFYLDGGNVFIGATGIYTLTPDIDFEPGIEYVMGINHVTRFVLDANARYNFNLRGVTVRPFAMAGVGLAMDRSSFASGSDTRFRGRLNLGGGTVFNTRSLIQYWGGIKIYLLSEDNSDVALQGGVVFFL